MELKSRRIHIFEFEIIKISLPEIYFRVTCSKGTYIRSLAKDFGEILVVGGYLKQLNRTKIGDYSLQHAQQLETLIDQIKLAHEGN